VRLGVERARIKSRRPFGPWRRGRDGAGNPSTRRSPSLALPADSSQVPTSPSRLLRSGVWLGREPVSLSVGVSHDVTPLLLLDDAEREVGYIGGLYHPRAFQFDGCGP
jgi:hypothetical protein